MSSSPASARPRPAGRRIVAGITVIALVIAAAIAAAAASVEPDRSRHHDGPPAAAGCTRPWIAPVDAPITDPFRPPEHRYGPGNRGIEYGTRPGQAVVAVADGTVEFAGPVAGHPVVVIAHGAGLRSSYVQLLDAAVSRGHVVASGQRIATAAAAFHLGVRRGNDYVDPSRLIDRLCLVVRLVAL